MNDAYPDGTFRGWADLVATRLAVESGPDFGYANLAVRGKLLDEVIGDRVLQGAVGYDMLKAAIEAARAG